MKEINYKSYVIKRRKSICDDMDYYFAIYKDGKLRSCVSSLELAKLNIDEWINN